MLLSIIIPVYNGEKTISQCLESIIKVFRKYKNEVEIIVVNDGSKDNTIKKVKEVNYSNLRLISKSNRGVSSARNRGIKAAVGNYIWFIDSDDYLLNFDADELIELITTHLEIDMILFGFKKKTSKDSVKVVVNSFHKILNRSEFINKFSSIFAENEFNVPWNRIVRRSIITKNNLFFDTSMKTGEDAVFNSEVVNFVTFVSIINKPLYVYNLFYSRYDKSYNPELRNNLLKLSQALKDMVETQGIDDYFYWNKYERMNYTVFANLVRKCKNYKEVKDNLNAELLPEQHDKFSKLSIKAKIFFLLIKFSFFGYLKEEIFNKTGTK